jgi:hypothetical protein
MSAFVTCNFNHYRQGDKEKMTVMKGTRSVHEGSKKFLQNFGYKGHGIVGGL